MRWASFAFLLELRLLRISSKGIRLFTVIPRVRKGSESIAPEAEGQMGYFLRRHEGERNNCLSKIQLVGRKYRDKTTLAS